MLEFNMKFSVTIPAYKAKFLKEAIESVLSQTYDNFELIIVDDNSPENLKAIVDGFSDSRIRYFRNSQNCGAVNVVDNWNICLSYCTGDYVICMGDDDRLLPNCLYEYLKLINKYPGIGILHGWTEIIDENSCVTKPTAHRCEIESAMSLVWHRFNVYHLQFIGDFCFEKDWLLQKGGFFKLPMAWGSDDISAIIGATKNGIANTQKVVFQYRFNSQTITKSGDPEIKMKAVILDYQWRRAFISSKCDNEVDELYRRDLVANFERIYNNKKAVTIALDIYSKSIIRLFYWIFKRKEYLLSMKIIANSLLHYLRLELKKYKSR